VTTSTAGIVRGISVVKNSLVGIVKMSSNLSDSIAIWSFKAMAWRELSGLAPFFAPFGGAFGVALL
jgi:hypothetical protein